MPDMSNWKEIAIAIAIPQACGYVGTFKSRETMKKWYRNIKKPFFTPPNWVFGPVWTSIYTAMGYASYLVWRDGGGFHGEAATALQIYAANLAFNTAWSPIFFGARRIGLAAIDCIPLWGTAFACIRYFGPINPTAGKLLLPYLCWLSYATVLNVTMWYLNKDEDSE